MKKRRNEEKSKIGNIGKGRLVPTCLVGLEPQDPYPNGAPENGISMEGHHKDESIDKP